MKGLQCYIVAACFTFAVLYPKDAILSVNALDQPTTKRKAKGLSIPTNPSVWRVDNIQLDPPAETDEEINDSEIRGEGEATSMPDTASDAMEMTNASTRRKELRISSSIKFLQQRFWNRLDSMDAMDKMIMGSTLPLVGLTSIVPLVSTAELYWVNQLGDTLAVSAHSAANSVFQFSFGLFSFLPSVTATLVSKNYANNDMERTENTIITAFYFGLIACSVMSIAIFKNPSGFLGAVMKDGSPARAMSEKFMKIRCLSLIPQMISFLCFSACRGMLVFKPCIKITLIAAALNMASTPLLIHVFGLGILGSAISAFICDSVAASLYMKLMISKGFFARKKLLRFPTWNEVSPMVKGTSLQARSFAMQFTNLMVARKIQSLDNTGVAPAAFSLAMQMFVIGGVVIWALGMSTQTLYPNSVAKCEEEGREIYVKSLIKRLLGRGFGIGTFISCIQLLFIPFALRSTPIPEVRQAALFPLFVVVVFQGIQGLVSVGEGIMVGDGKFSLASIVIVFASLGYLGCLQLFPESWGINGVFIALGVFTLLRLTGFAIFLPSIINHHTLPRANDLEKSA